MLAAVPAVATAQKVAQGIVFLDQDRDGQHGPGEPPLPGVRVSNGRDVVPTRKDGRYELSIDDDILFVIKPRGYMTPVDSLNLPRFYNIRKPAGSPEALRYAGGTPTGPLPESIGFPLLQHDEPRVATAARDPGAMLETAAAPEARPDLAGLAVQLLVESAQRISERDQV